MSAKASLAYFFSRGASGALAVATISLFARTLGPEGYGRLALTVTASAFIAGVLIQPLHQCLARFLPRSGYESILPTLGKALLLACVGALPVALLLEVVPQTWLPAGVPLMAVVLGCCQGLFDFAAQYCSSTLQARRYGRLYFLKAVLVPALGGVALWLGWGASGAVLAMGCGFVLSMLVSAREPWLKVLRGRFDSRYLPEIRRYALPMGASLLVGVLLQWSDRLVLAAHVDHAALGGYSAAGDFAIQGFGLVFSAFHLAWFPRLVAAWERSHDEAQSLLDRYIQLSAVLLVPASLGLALVSADVISLFLGRGFAADATRVMPWLVAAATLNGVRTYFTDLSLHLRQAMHRQSVIVGVCAGFSILANLWAVPRYGVIAAAMVAVLSNALGLVLSVMAGWGVLRFRAKASDLIGIVCGCALLAGVVWLIPGGSAVGLTMRVAAGGVVYGVVMWVFNTADLRRLALARLRRAE